MPRLGDLANRVAVLPADFGLAAVGYLSACYATMALTDALTGLGNRSRPAGAAAAGFDLLQGCYFGRPMPAGRVSPAVAL